LAQEARIVVEYLRTILPRSDGASTSSASAGTSARTDEDASIIIPLELPDYKTVGELRTMVETGNATCSPMINWINPNCALAAEQPWHKAWATTDLSTKKKKLSVYLQNFCFVKFAVHFGKLTADTTIVNKTTISNLSAGVFKHGSKREEGLIAIGGEIPSEVQFDSTMDYHTIALKIIAFLEKQ
jgi:hypothetical protein